MIPREELAAMRADPAAYISDLPRLIEEVERLRRVASDLSRGVRLLEESFDDADERRPKWLHAALYAAEGGE